jgi:L-lysine exporter family protein LysE/ArgO
MSDISVFLYGFVLALGLILPLGPQNSYIITIGSQKKHYVQTLPVVVTAALCDTFLIVLAVTGVSVTIMNVVWLKMLMVVVGVVFLTYLGWASLKEDTSLAKPQNAIPDSYLRQIVVAASLSLINPFAILDTVAVIGTNAMTYDGFQRILFTGTCILVSWLWFLGLAKVSQVLGARFHNCRWRQWLVAIMLWVSAILLVYRLLVVNQGFS